MNDISRTVHVALGARSYDIEIGRNLLSDAASRIRSRIDVSSAIVISDTNVSPLYAKSLSDSLAPHAIVQLLTVPPGEPSKSVEQAAQLWNQTLEGGADRSTVIIAVGGGVVGDLAGFVAATFARGVPFIQVPTSLLAQVDSSVGGKVGINLAGAKNIIGAFWQPKYVLIDVDVLSTLPEREFSAGMAEVIKYGVIADADFFGFLEQHLEQIRAKDPTIMSEVIARCCEIKAEVVEADECETSGRRATLNYGHTFGHALESIAGYGQYLHGEAIAIGMMCAARLAEKLGRIDSEFVDRQQRLLEAFQLPIAMPNCDRDEFLKIMNRDKKVQHGRLRLILPTRLGDVELVEDVDETAIRSVL